LTAKKGRRVLTAGRVDRCSWDSKIGLF